MSQWRAYGFELFDDPLFGSGWWRWARANGMIAPLPSLSSVTEWIELGREVCHERVAS
jgi:hypothetical protein